MPIPTRSEVPRTVARSRAADPHMDSFGAWVSFLVVFASVMGVIVVWQNFNDHAYSLATNVQPHVIAATVAER